MKFFAFLIAIPLLTGTSAFAQPDCAPMAKKAALALGVINQEPTEFIEVLERSNGLIEQVFEVTFDTADRGASVTYTVTVERNASGIEDQQFCARVRKIEITAEE